VNYSIGGESVIKPSMAQHGALLFTFGLLTLGMQQATSVTLFPWLPPPPEFLCLAARLILFILSMVGIFLIGKCMRDRKGWRKHLLYLPIVLLALFMFWMVQSVPLPRIEYFQLLAVVILFLSLLFIVAIFCSRLANVLEYLLERYKHLYWMVAYIVYAIGWIKGLSTLPANGLYFQLVSLLGVPWFFAFTFLLLKASWQTGKPG